MSWADRDSAQGLKQKSQLCPKKRGLSPCPSDSIYAKAYRKRIFPRDRENIAVFKTGYMYSLSQMKTGGLGLPRKSKIRVCQGL